MSIATDAEWTLEAGPWRCTVSPRGASLRSLWLEREGQPRRDVLWGYTGTKHKRGGQGDVLMPWPGRVRDGKYSFAGQPQTLVPNDKDGPNAIHGFLRSRPWEGAHDGPAAHFRTQVTDEDYPGYPFSLDVLVGYELLPSGLACAFVVRNTGKTPAPFGAGFHPYILAGAAPTDRVDAMPLKVPASRLVEYEALLPTGRVLEVPPDLDFRTPRSLGDVRLNHCFTDLARDEDGFARVAAGDIEVWMDKAFPYLVLYTGDALGGDARKALAIEPMTCATDAFNHPAWGLKPLAAGETFAGTWGVALAGLERGTPLV